MLSKKYLVVVLILCFSCASWAAFVDQSLISVTPSDVRLPGAWATNLIDGSGLQPDLTLNTDVTDGQNWLSNIDFGRWLWDVPNAPQHNTSPSGVVYTDGWIQFEFSAAQAIDQMWIWNYNNPNYLGRGLKTVAVDYSTDGTTWTRLGGGDTYLTFAQAPGTNGYVCNNLIDFGGVSVKKVVLNSAWNPGNYGDPSWSGLSEVRFEVVPEPATMMLLGLGVLGMITKKRA